MPTQVNLYRLQMHNSTIHHLDIAWCVHHPMQVSLHHHLSAPYPPSPSKCPCAGLWSWHTLKENKLLNPSASVRLVGKAASEHTTHKDRRQCARTDLFTKQAQQSLSLSAQQDLANKTNTQTQKDLGEQLFFLTKV